MTLHRLRPALLTALLSLPLLSLPLTGGGAPAGATPPARDWVTAPSSVGDVDLTPGSGTVQVLRVLEPQPRVRLRSARAHRAPAGTHRLRWSVRVRTERDRTISLVLRSSGDGERLRRRTVRVPGGQWTTVRLTTGTKRAGYRPVVVARGLARGERLRLKPVRIRPVSDTQQPGNPPRENSPGDGCRYTVRGLPSCGSYLGMAYGSNSDPAPLERELGTPVGVRRTYYRADQVASAVRTARADIAHGRLPWISFKFPHSWEAMAAGKGDAWAKSLAAEFDQLPGPVWLAFHHEPETDGDIQAWRRAQERLVPLVRGHADNIAYTVVLTGWHQFYGPAEYSLDAIWPRGVKVDVAGFDVYNSHGVVKDGREMAPTRMDSAYFAKISAWAKQQGVAWGIAETGFTDTAFREDPTWIQRTRRELESRDGVAMAYFNSGLNSIASWELGTGRKWEAFAQANPSAARLPAQ
ncbi:hypothetical protein [Nocardioides daejeonensis]|uniref:hypothetical protein n=1 Tax=Nocardioides daejeonensis TaxID=1046556 RepID=UPI000D74A234|nr:hypothetical protein [Nocardioides daejeonensis]